MIIEALIESLKPLLALFINDPLPLTRSHIFLVYCYILTLDVCIPDDNLHDFKDIFPLCTGHTNITDKELGERPE